MISPHLIKVKESFSTAHVTYQMAGAAKLMAEELWANAPVLTLDSNNKNPKWCHMVLAEGPALSEEAQGSTLVIIWWSEMGPDTDRVLKVVDWEKQAKDIPK